MQWLSRNLYNLLWSLLYFILSADMVLGSGLLLVHLGNASEAGKVRRRLDPDGGGVGSVDGSDRNGEAVRRSGWGERPDARKADTDSFSSASSSSSSSNQSGGGGAGGGGASDSGDSSSDPNPDQRMPTLDRLYSSGDAFKRDLEGVGFLAFGPFLASARSGWNVSTLFATLVNVLLTQADRRSDDEARAARALNRCAATLEAVGRTLASPQRGGSGRGSYRGDNGFGSRKLFRRGRSVKADLSALDADIRAVGGARLCVCVCVCVRACV